MFYDNILKLHYFNIYKNVKYWTLKQYLIFHAFICTTLNIIYR